MLIKKDFDKLKKIFVTKKDLKKELSNYPTKDYLDKQIGNLSKEIGEYFRDVFEKLNEINNKSADYDDILNNHERRLDKIEDKIFTTTSS